MKIISQLSSQIGDRTEGSNRKVAGKCLKDPLLLIEISEGLSSNDSKISSDCAEVMTEVAIVHPELVVKFAPELIRLIQHKHTKTRWEALHTLSLISTSIPQAIESILPDLEEITVKDKSTIVRDYATQIIARFAGIDQATAKKAFPILKRILDQWQDKQAVRVLEGMRNAWIVLPSLKTQIIPIAESYTDSKIGVAKKAALKLLKTFN
jgi:hypothetical protein